MGGVDFAPHLYIKEGAEAVEHLFSVASGLDSMVIGETEITGQVKQAYQAAQEAKLTGRVTNRLFQTALQVAKEIRTQTGIGRGATSVGSVAVDLAERIFDRDLSGKTVMIIGAGKMGEACIRHLAKRGARSVLVSNRSYDRALSLANEFGGRAVRFDECLTAMAQADIVVSSTGSPQTILHRDDVASVMAGAATAPSFSSTSPCRGTLMPRSISSTTFTFTTWIISKRSSARTCGIANRNWPAARPSSPSGQGPSWPGSRQPRRRIFTQVFQLSPHGRWTPWWLAPADPGHQNHANERKDTFDDRAGQ